MVALVKSDRGVGVSEGRERIYGGRPLEDGAISVEQSLRSFNRSRVDVQNGPTWGKGGHQDVREVLLQDVI
jgi:hypothetical protein